MWAGQTGRQGNTQNRQRGRKGPAGQTYGQEGREQAAVKAARPESSSPHTSMRTGVFYGVFLSAFLTTSSKPFSLQYFVFVAAWFPAQSHSRGSFCGETPPLAKTTPIQMVSPVRRLCAFKLKGGASPVAPQWQCCPNKRPHHRCQTSNLNPLPTDVCQEAQIPNARGALHSLGFCSPSRRQGVGRRQMH